MTVNIDIVRRALSGRPHRSAPTDGRDRYAAVATILRERNGTPEVLLIRRAHHARDPWSGHMALPGGRRDPADSDLLATALRETREEVGFELDAETELAGRLDDQPAMARGRPVGMIIAPFVFAIDRDPPLVNNPLEVQAAIWAPLGPLARGERNTTVPYEFEGQSIALPAFDVDGHLVWGLTHRMLCELFSILDDERRTR